jgi:hypothetical protein
LLRVLPYQYMVTSTEAHESFHKIVGLRRQQASQFTSHHHDGQLIITRLGISPNSRVITVSIVGQHRLIRSAICGSSNNIIGRISYKRIHIFCVFIAVDCPARSHCNWCIDVSFSIGLNLRLSSITTHDIAVLVEHLKEREEILERCWLSSLMSLIFTDGSKIFDMLDSSLLIV